MFTPKPVGCLSRHKDPATGTAVHVIGIALIGSPGGTSTLGAPPAAPPVPVALRPVPIAPPGPNPAAPPAAPDVPPPDPAAPEVVVPLPPAIAVLVLPGMASAVSEFEPHPATVAKSGTPDAIRTTRRNRWFIGPPPLWVGRA
jgi:hypothetical protein